MLEHKGYTGVMEVDVEAGVIFGRVIGLRDVVTFQGETVAQAIQAFRDSVDDYLEFCAGRGEDPEKPYSGKFVLRLRPELHRALAKAAEASRVSLNGLIENILEIAVPSEARHGDPRAASDRGAPQSGSSPADRLEGARVLAGVETLKDRGRRKSLPGRPTSGRPRTKKT